MNTWITREPVSGEADFTLEMPKEVLMAIRIRGAYDEVTVDPASGRVLAHIHLTGRYDSYSDTYEINGGKWKIEGHKSWPSGEDTSTMRLEEYHAKPRRAPSWTTP